MSLISLKLKNFRNHKKTTLNFPLTTVIVGQNTVGKTSILESIQFLSFGKSFRANHESDCITEGCDFSNIESVVSESDGNTNLKVILANQETATGKRFTKKFLVNNVSRRQFDFVSHFTSVLFTPEDLEIIIDSPTLRRNYVNSILSQTDKKYRICLSIYEKALRQRNRMLYLLREGKKYFSPADFEYWDNILINNGNYLTDAREKFVGYINGAVKEVFDFEIFYDKSVISVERLQKYYDAERASATTLVGPNRDDFFFFFKGTKKFISEFGSRGEQRLTIFQMKLLEIGFIENATKVWPVLLLDDIFSELDSQNIKKVIDLLPQQQTILTTTHKEFVPVKILKREEVEIIEL